MTESKLINIDLSKLDLSKLEPECDPTKLTDKELLDSFNSLVRVTPSEEALADAFQQNLIELANQPGAKELIESLNSMSGGQQKILIAALSELQKAKCTGWWTNIRRNVDELRRRVPQPDISTPTEF